MVLSQNERLFSTPVNLFSFKEKLRERELKTKPNQLLDSDPVPPIKPTQGASESTGSACSIQQLLRQVASTERMPTAHKALFAHYCRVLCVEPGAAAGDIESAFNELATDDVRSSARGGDPAAVYLLSSLKLAKDTLLNDRVRERFYEAHFWPFGERNPEDVASPGIDAVSGTEAASTADGRADGDDNDKQRDDGFFDRLWKKLPGIGTYWGHGDELADQHNGEKQKNGTASPPPITSTKSMPLQSDPSISSDVAEETTTSSPSAEAEQHDEDGAGAATGFLGLPKEFEGVLLRIRECTECVLALKRWADSQYGKK